MADLTVVHRHHIVLDDDTKTFLRDLARPILSRLNQLENHMTQIGDFLAGENATLDAITTALADVAADVTALLAKAGTAGVFSPEEQASADAASAKLAAVGAALASLDTEVGDQDGSDTPPAQPEV